MVEIDARHRSLLMPPAAARGAADAAVRVEDHEVARIDEDLDRLVRLEDRGCRASSITQRTSAKSRWTKLSEPVISVTEHLGRDRHRRRRRGRASERWCGWKPIV